MKVKRFYLLLVLIMLSSFVGCSGKEPASDNNNESSVSSVSVGNEEVKQDTSSEIDEQEMSSKYSVPVQTEKNVTKSEEVTIVELSEEELNRVISVIENHYSINNRNISELVQVDYETSFIREYEGYEPDEVVLFEVSIENSENKRYITIGSKDDWYECNVLNEGY